MKYSQVYLLIANMFIVGSFVVTDTFTTFLLIFIALAHLFLSYCAMKTETMIGRLKRELNNIQRDVLFDIAKEIEKFGQALHEDMKKPKGRKRK